MTGSSIDAELDVIARADAVEFTFTVTDAGEEAVELQFRNGLAADFTVLDGDTAVWRWSDGRMFTQARWTEPLGPDDAVFYEATWRNPVPGAYEVVATLEAENADIEARTSFRV